MTETAVSGRLAPIRLLQVTAFVATFDRFAMPPMLIAIAHDLGVPLAAIVQAASAYFLAYGLMQPVWGIVSDSLGRVRTMRLTLLLAAVMTILSAFAWSPLTVGVFRGMAGAFFGAAYPSSLIYLGDTVAVSRRQHQIAQLMVGVALGTALASLGAGVVAQVFTWRAAFVVTGVAALVMAVALRRLAEPVRQTARRHPLAPLGDAVRSRWAMLVVLLAFVEGMVLLGVLTVLPSAVEAAGATAGVAGAVTGVYGVAVFGSARLVGRLSRRTHPSRLIAMGACAALAACAALTISRSPAVAVLVALLLGLAWVSMHSSLQTWATEVIPHARAAIVSLFAGALFVGSAVAAAAVAGLVQAERYDEVFLLAGAITVPLGVVATWTRARWHRPSEVTGAP